MNTFRLLLLSLLFAAIPISGFSYTDDQVVDFGDCYYKVVSGTKLTLSFLGMKPGKTGPIGAARNRHRQVRIRTYHCRCRI